MIYLKWFIFACLSFGLNLFLWVTCWFWALIPATFKLKNLPGPLYYFQTHDAWVYGWGREPKLGLPPTWMERWKLATWWIARNPGYAFDAFIIGYPAKPDAPKWAEDIPMGWLEFQSADGKTLWSYRTDKVWFGWKPTAPTGRHMLVVHAKP